MRKKQSFSIKLILGVIIIVFLFYKIGFIEIFQTLINMRIHFLPLIFFFYFLNFIIEALKLKVLTSFFNPNIPFKKLLSYNFYSWAMGNFSPSKVGEFSMPLFLKKHNINLGKGFALSFLSKGAMVFTVSIIAIFSVFIFFSFQQAIIFFLIIIGTFLIGSLLLFTKFVRTIVKKYILRKYASKFEGFSKTFLKFLRNGKRHLVSVFILSSLKLASMAMVTYLLLLSFGIDIEYISVIEIMSITILAGLIPITMNGLGVKQSIGVFLYNEIGIQMSKSMGNYAFLILVNYILSALLLIHLLFFRKKTKT